MARQRKWTAYFTPTVNRTLERVAIAALAALATRGDGHSVAIVALTIFVVVAVVEELGRGWVAHGKRVTLRDLAYSSFIERRIQRAGSRSCPKKRRRGVAARSADGKADPRDGHGSRGEV